METKKVICSKISVDCIKNDPVDVRAGGPDILGFDFFVETGEVNNAVSLIKKTIAEYQLPLMGIDILDQGKLLLGPEEVWTSSRIINAIAAESEYIISEANHQKIYQKY